MRALAPAAAPRAQPLASRRRAAARAAAAQQPPSPARPWSAAAAAAARALDDQLSARPLQLDPAGYFLIAALHDQGLIRCEHYENSINAQGLACDPRTGQVIPCSGYAPPPPRTFTGATAKAVAVAVLEGAPGQAAGAEEAARGAMVSRLEHAAYLGRELQRAEEALRTGAAYVQD